MPDSQINTNAYIRVSRFKKGDRFDSIAEARRHETEFSLRLYEAWSKGQLPQEFDPDKKIIGQVVDYIRKPDQRFVTAILPFEGARLDASKIMARGNYIECDKLFLKESAESQKTIKDGGWAGNGYIDMNDSLTMVLANAGEFDKVYEIAKKTGKLDPEVLHAAVRLDDVKAAIKLIDEFHVNVEHEIEHGLRTPLHLVKSIKMFDALVARKANVLHIDDFGDPITHYYGRKTAAYEPKKEQPEKGLLKHANSYIEKTHGPDALEKARAAKPDPDNILTSLLNGIPLEEPKANLAAAFKGAKSAQDKLFAKLDETSKTVRELAKLGRIDKNIADQITQSIDTNLKIDFFGDYKEPKNLIDVMNESQSLKEKTAALSDHVKVVTGFWEELHPLIEKRDTAGIQALLKTFVPVSPSPVGVGSAETPDFLARGDQRKA